MPICDIIYTIEEENNMPTNWTSNQLQAINKKGNNILVAAAARKR